MRTILVIQQRLGSRRLPRKALLPLCGKSMTWHIVERCKQAKLVDEVVVATPFDDAEEIDRAIDCQVVAPQVPENDLIARYYTVAAGMKADFIVRVSGDNPCVEPEEIDLLLGPNLWRALCLPTRFSLEMTSESVLHCHDGFGGELYSTKILEWMDKTIKEPRYREHPHKFWIDINKATYFGKHYPPSFRLDVDTQADYEKIRDIYEALYPANPNFTVKDMIEYLDGKRQVS